MYAPAARPRGIASVAACGTFGVSSGWAGVSETPGGSETAVSVAVPAKPPRGSRTNVRFAERPWRTDGEGGVARTLKSACETVTWTFTCRVTLTPAPPFAPEALNRSVTAPAGASSAARMSTGNGTPGESGNAAGTTVIPGEPVTVTSTPPDQPFSGTSVTWAAA